MSRDLVRGVCLPPPACYCAPKSKYIKINIRGGDDASEDGMHCCMCNLDTYAVRRSIVYVLDCDIDMSHVGDV